MLIVSPIITEKTVALANSLNQFTFKVSARANKVEAAKELSKLFDVKVLAVKSHNRLGRPASFGKYRRGKTITQGQKIMIFKLKDGDKIDSFNQ